MRYTILQVTALPGSPSGFYVNENVPLAELDARFTQKIELDARFTQKIELDVRI